MKELLILISLHKSYDKPFFINAYYKATCFFTDTHF